MNDKYRPRRGQALIMITLGAVVLFTCVGMVIDIGWAYYRQQTAQAAADAAALAAASSTVSGLTDGPMRRRRRSLPMISASATCTPVCGTGGVTCQGATVCPTSLPNPPTTTAQEACLYAKTNGFTAGGSQNVTVAANTTSPPSGMSGVAVNYWVTVSITEQETQLFSSILGHQFMTSGVHATAAALPGSGGGGCIYVLATTGSSVTNSGTATIQSGCGIYVNSSSSSAVLTSGSPKIVTTGGATTNIVGNYLFSGTNPFATGPAPVTGVTATADPFTSMAPPTVGACTYSSAVVVSSNSTLNPGVYCGGITTSGTETITLNPGLYIIKSGITESGSPTFNGSGVTLYFQSGGITGSGSGTFNLSAPTSGTWQGVVLYEDRSDSSGITLSGSTGTLVNGLVYMPKGNLTYSGDSGTSGVVTTLVVNAITFSGTSYINQAATTAYGPTGCPVRLIQ